MESLLRDSVTERTNPMASQGGQEARYHAGGRSGLEKIVERKGRGEKIRRTGMEITLNVSEHTAELLEEFRLENETETDIMVSKLIPYGIFRKEVADVVNLFFENARSAFLIEEVEEGLGRSVTDQELRELIIASLFMGMPEGTEAEIDVAYNSSIAESASVRLEGVDWSLSCEELVADVCRDLEELPLLDLYSCYEAEDGTICEEIPEGEEEKWKEITVADCYYCSGVEPDDLETIRRVKEIPESHSCDYLSPDDDPYAFSDTAEEAGVEA